MTRWDQPAPRIVPANRAKLLKSGRAVLGHMLEPQPARMNRNALRLLEIERLIEHRRGGDFDTPHEAYLWAAMPDLLFVQDRPRCPAYRASTFAWTLQFLPELHDHGPEWFDEIEAEFSTYPRPKPLRADTCGNKLDVSREERLTLNLRTIRAVGLTTAEMAEARREQKIAYKRARRLEEGATPREQSQARQGWEWEGRLVSRRTYFRLAAAARGTSSDPTCEAISAPVSGRLSDPISARGTSSDPISPVGTMAGPEPVPSPKNPSLGGALARRRRQAKTELATAPTLPDQPPTERSEPMAERPSGRCLPGEGASAASGSHSPHTTPVAKADRATVPSQEPDAVQLSMLVEAQTRAELETACEAYLGGSVPAAIVTAYEAAARRRAVRQEDAARAIGISRPQLANALQGTFGLSDGAAARLKGWLLIEDAGLPPAPVADERQSARPRARRGAKGSSGSGRGQTKLTLLAVIVGGRVDDRPGSLVLDREAA